MKLADSNESAVALPLATHMQNATLTLGGRPLLLKDVSTGQVNAQLPYGVPAGTTQQLIAQHGNRLSVPQPVSIASAEPAIFTTDLTGRGQGHIYVATAITQTLADAANPAQAGDVIVIYCSGLGPVSPDVLAGAAVPTDALHQTVGKTTLIIGGVPATVQFAGLTPGYSGLYQINAVVPAGVTPGDAVVVAVGSNVGPTVTMAVR